MDSPWASSAIVAIIYLLFIVARLSTHGYDPSYFVVASDGFCKPQLVPKNLSVLYNSNGYDGQFYYRLALDPFTSKSTDFGITLDSPSLRQQRILYPLTVWFLSGGHFSPVPAMMILVNYLALCWMAWIGGAYAHSMKQHALWGIVFPFYPGFLLTLSRDLTEILEISLLLASLLLIRQGRHLFGASLLSLAILTKETALIAVAGVIGVALSRAWRGNGTTQLKLHFLLLPLTIYSAWQLLLLYRWESFPLFEYSHPIGPPFIGFINFFLYTAVFETYLQRLWSIELCFIIVFAISVAISLRSSVALAHEKLSWLFYTTLMVLLSNSIWIEDWGFLRALSEFYVLGAIILIGSESKIKAPLFTGSIILWVLLFVREIR